MSDDVGPWPGHAVLQVPVPALEPFVRERTAHHDGAFVAADPAFVHAHVTALAPFLTSPSAADLATVAAIASDTRAFETVLAEVAAFPDGIIYLRPDPDSGFRDLTGRLCRAFPDHLPYGGRYGPAEAIVPHLTLDLSSAEISVVSTRRLLGDAVPVTVRAERLDLVWYEASGCRLMDSWPFS